MFLAMIWSTVAAWATLLLQELPVHSPPIDCSCPPPPAAPRLRFLRMIMSPLCLVRGARLPLAGKFQLVSVPVGHHSSGTVPDELNRRSSRDGDPSAQASSRGIRGTAAALIPSALSSCRRERPFPSWSVLSSFMASPSGGGKHPNGPGRRAGRGSCPRCPSSP